MIKYIVALVILVFILAKLGVLRRKKECCDCHKKLRGTKQKIFGYGQKRFVLCKDCMTKIHPQILDFAKINWGIEDYNDYLAWEKETREERDKFVAIDKYSSLMMDGQHGLFTFGKNKLSGIEPGLILRFKDIIDWDINFKAYEVKKGLLSDKVRGDEYAMVYMASPNVMLKVNLNYSVSYKLKKEGIFSSKYKYDFSQPFQETISAFSIYTLIFQGSQEAGNDTSSNVGKEFDEIQKALALFMFDSMDDVTAENLKKQRNALIKAFHPDGGMDNDAYAQKINAAYEVLNKAVSK